MSRPTGTAAELERRRRQAVTAVQEGECPETVARIFGVARVSVYRWLAAARQPDGLAAKPHPGPAPRLSPEQHRRLEELLYQGPQAHGWRNKLWTCARVGELIRRHFGVSFHHDHVGRLLHQRLGWSPQKPHRRARERDQAAVDFWRTYEFPRIATAARQRGAHLVFLDESGFMLTPTVRRTWAPRGSKPVLDCWDRRDRISAISALTVSPKAGRLNLFFDLLPDNTNVHGEDVVDFLKQLKQHLGGPFTVLWDGSNVHSKSRLVRAYLAEHPEIVTATLPAYAPDINPDELVWGWTKYGRLSNLAAADTDWLRDYVIDDLVHLQANPELLASFIEKTRLPLAA
jgi:transposase